MKPQAKTSVPPLVPCALLMLTTQASRSAGEHNVLLYICAAAAHTRGQKQIATFNSRASYLNVILLL